MTMLLNERKLGSLFPKRVLLFKSILFFLVMTTVPSDIWGQYSFTVNAQYNGGNCENMRESFNSVLANHAQEMAAGFVTKSECEIVRAGIIETAKDIEALYQGVYGHFGANMSCSIKVIASPCVSRSGIGAAGDVDLFASGRGGAMFFQNPAVEVSNWAKENERLMSIIGGITDAASFNPRITGDDDFDRTLVLNLDKPFVSVNMREGGFSTTSSSDLSMRNKVFEAPDYSQMANMENVNRYLGMCSDLAKRYIEYPDPDHLVDWFHEEFKKVSGFDLDTIMRKLPSQRSQAEQQALYDYQVFRARLADKMLEDLKPYIAVQEETRAYEMAVLSANSYGDLAPLYLETTNYMKKTSSDFGVNDPMRALAEKIEEYNGKFGFHAELYYNSVTGEYTVAFEGSNSLIDKPIDGLMDWEGNIIENGLYGIHPQYILAYNLGQLVANALPEGVNVNFTGHSLGGGDATVAAMASGATAYAYNPEFVSDIAQLIGNLKDNGNIHTWKTDDDPLSGLQDNIPIGQVRPAMGDVRIIKTGGRHDIKPMVEVLNEGRGTFTAWQNSIHNAGYGHELQTQETIMIYTGE